LTLPNHAVAIVFASPRQVELCGIRVPEPRADEVVVQTELTGISVGTDRWMIDGKYRGVGERFPFVYGYQRVGKLIAVGPAVPPDARLAVGDRVFVGLSGSRLDPSDGLGEMGGGYTSVGVAHYSDVWPLGDSKDLDLAEVALGGVAAVALQGVEAIDVQPDELVVVIGQGMIGQVAAQLARARGARVIATDLLASRQEAAAKWSADRVVDPASESLPEVVLTERAGLGSPRGYGPGGPHPSRYEQGRWDSVDGGADAVIDTAGSARLVGDWVALLRRGGRLCLQAYYPDPLVLDFHAIHHKRLRFAFPGGFDLEGFGRVIDHLRAGRLRVAPLISHRLPASSAPEAFALLQERPDEVLGMVLDWR
jgi:2-desacetyl-2-hydroxyethyl bacteriochlorophyllide A dehydrogenase